MLLVLEAGLVGLAWLAATTWGLLGVNFFDIAFFFLIGETVWCSGSVCTVAKEVKEPVGASLARKTVCNGTGSLEPVPDLVTKMTS